MIAKRAAEMTSFIVMDVLERACELEDKVPKLVGNGIRGDSGHREQVSDDNVPRIVDQLARDSEHKGKGTELHQDSNHPAIKETGTQPQARAVPSRNPKATHSGDRCVHQLHSGQGHQAKTQLKQ